MTPATRRTYHGTKLTSNQWKELKLTGCVIVGDKIIRTLAFIDRVQKGAKQDIQKHVKRLFNP